MARAADVEGGPRRAGRGPGKRHLRVLVLEDEPDFSALLVDVLSAEGHTVACWDSGLGAVGTLREWQPDVVLLDLGLPYRSGASLLSAFKEDPATAAVPIVVVSAVPEALPPERRTLAAAILTKPVDLQVLLDTVRAAVTPGSRTTPARRRRLPVADPAKGDDPAPDGA